jgi:hypothetical protein
MAEPPIMPPNLLIFADGRKVPSARYRQQDGLWSPWGGVYQTYRGVVWCKVEDGSWRVFEESGAEIYRAESWREASELALLWPPPDSRSTDSGSNT